MKNLIEYKGYVGSGEFSQEDELFYGKVQGIRALISYEGTNAAELMEDFHVAVDNYLELCQEEGKEQKKHTKVLLISAFLRNFIKRLPSMQWNMT